MKEFNSVIGPSPVWREKKAKWRSSLAWGNCFLKVLGESQFHTKLNHHLHTAQNIFKVEM